MLGVPTKNRHWGGGTEAPPAGLFTTYYVLKKSPIISSESPLSSFFSEPQMINLSLFTFFIIWGIDTLPRCCMGTLFKGAGGDGVKLQASHPNLIQNPRRSSKNYRKQLEKLHWRRKSTSVASTFKTNTAFRLESQFICTIEGNLEGPPDAIRCLIHPSPTVETESQDRIACLTARVFVAGWRPAHLSMSALALALSLQHGRRRFVVTQIPIGPPWSAMAESCTSQCWRMRNWECDTY